MTKSNGVTDAKLSDLLPDEQNANLHSERGQYMVNRSIEKLGAGRSILLDKNNRIIAGNLTTEQAADIGLDDVVIVDSDGKKLIAVRRTDMDLDDPDSGAREMAYADNRGAEVSITFDPDQVAADIEAGLDLGDWWKDIELEEMGAIEPDVPEDVEPQIDKAEELREKWGVELGQLWRLGDHRVICGDCTDAAVVERLMAGEKADMMFTDPPYGVGYEGGHFHSGDVKIKRKREELAGDKNQLLYAEFLPVVLPIIDGPCYVWFASSVGKPVYDAVLGNGCTIHAMIVWHKTNATYAAMNAQYKQRHEPCLYFKPKNSTLRWTGPTDECTIWEIDRDGQNKFHPTQKPVQLAERAIGNHDVDTVADFFVGSGSTIIACERLARKCYGVEIEPKYVAVTLQRWADVTGKTPELVETVTI